MNASEQKHSFAKEVGLLEAHLLREELSPAFLLKSSEAATKFVLFFNPPSGSVLRTIKRICHGDFTLNSIYQKSITYYVIYPVI